MGSGSSSDVAKIVLGIAQAALPIALQALSGSEALNVIRCGNRKTMAILLGGDENDMTALATQSENKNMAFFYSGFSYEYNGPTSNPPNIADGAPCYGGQDFSFYDAKNPGLDDVKLYVMGQLTPATADGYDVDAIVADITQTVNGVYSGLQNVWQKKITTYVAPKGRGASGEKSNIFYMDLALYTYACQTDEGDTMVMFSFLFTLYGGTKW